MGVSVNGPDITGPDITGSNVPGPHVTGPHVADPYVTTVGAVDPSVDIPMVAFTSLFNFRDVGGYPGLDGRSVRRRRFYRSDSPHRIDTERAAFTALGVRTVIDLRRPQEVARDGRVPHYDGLDYRHIHPEHRDWADVPYDERLTVGGYLAERYLELAETGAAGLAAAVGVVAGAESAPVLVHCVAGKDRTGVVCALTLALLGVSDADIAADYTMSTAGSERFTAWIRSQLPIESRPLPAPLLASPPEAILLFLAGLRQRHGSVEGYLTEAGLPADRIEALQEHLLA